MNRLAIDTSTLTLQIAVLRDGQVTASRETPSKRGHASQLSESVAELLRDAQLPMSELHAVIVGEGPGSFTGLRIGLAWAKGVCGALDLPLFLAPSLGSVAFAPGLSPATRILAAMDARKSEIFGGVWRAGRADPELPLRAWTPSEWSDAVRALPTHPPEDTLRFGDAWDRIEAVREVALHAPLFGTSPRAEWLARWVEATGAPNTSLSIAEPLYVRPPDAVLPARVQRPPWMNDVPDDEPLLRVPGSDSPAT